MRTTGWLWMLSTAWALVAITPVTADDLPAGALQRLQMEGAVLATAFSPAGMPGAPLLAGAGEGGVIQLWEPATGKLVHALRRHTGTIRSLAFTADGTLVSGGSDKTIRIWDLKEAKELRKIDVPAEVLALAVSPDGKRLAAGSSDKDVRLWNDMASEPRVLEGHRQAVCALAFSPAGMPGAPLLASGSRDRTIRVWDLNRGREERILRGHKSWVRGVAFAPDGLAIASGAHDQALRLWDSWSGKTYAHLAGWDGQILAVACAPQAALVATGDANGTLRLWDMLHAKEIGQRKGHQDVITALAFAPDGRFVASASVDRSVIVWNLKEVKVPTPSAPPSLSADDVVQLWNLLLSDEDDEGACRAVRTLSLGPAQAVPFLRDRVRPVVRAEIDKVDRFIQDLNNDAFVVREKAEAELIARAQLALPALRQAIEGQLPSLEMRRRIERILDKLSLNMLALERVREQRAIEVLERSATPEAARLLEALAEGAPSSPLTVDARAALVRLQARKPPTK